MTALRPEQLAGFIARERARFTTRVAAQVAGTWPEDHARLGETGVAGLIAETVRAAAASGIVTERDVARCVHVAVALGTGVLSAPWARPLLAGRDRPAVRAFRLIEEGAARVPAARQAALRAGLALVDTELPATDIGAPAV